MAENISLGLSIEFPFSIAEKNLTQTLNQLQQTSNGLNVNLFNSNSIKKFNQSVQNTQQSFQRITQDSKLSSEAFKDLQTRVQAINKSASEYAKVTVNTYKNTKNIKSATIEYTDNVGKAVKETMAWTQHLDKAGGAVKNIFQTTGFKFVDDMKKANVETEKQAQLKEKQLQYEQKVRTAIDKTIKSEAEKTNHLELQLKLFKEQSTRQVDSLKAGGLKNIYSNSELQKYIKSVNTLKVSDKNLSEQMKVLNSQFQNIKNSAQNSSKALQVTNDKAQSLGSTIKKSAEKFMLWMGITGIFFAVTRSIKEMIAQVKILDDSQVSLLKVTNLTSLEIQGLTRSSFELGNTLGKTTSEVLNAIVSFSKMGYQANTEAAKLAETALMLTNIGDGISLENATSSIISALKGFELSANSAEKVINSYNNISNNFAVTTQDLATAVQTVSATMNQAGNSFDQTLSLFTASNEIINSASRSATGLRTIALRIRGVTEDGTELEGLVPSLEAKFNKFGLSLKKDDQTFKSTYDILRDLSTVYKQMSDFDFADISKDISGLRRSDILNAILQNFSSAEESLEASINSFGSAANENERFLSSISGALAKFNSQLQKLYTSTIKKDWVKNIVNIGTSILKVVDDVGLLSVALGGLIMYFGAFKTSLVSNMILKTAASMGTLVVGTKTAQIAVAGLNVSAKTLTTTLSFGLAVAIPAIIKGIQYLSESSDRYIESLEKQKQELEETISKNQEFIDTSSDVATQYKQLTSKTNLNNQELETLKTLQDQLLENYPDIIESVDEEGRLHLATADAIKKENEERNKLNASRLSKVLEKDIAIAEVKADKLKDKLKSIQETINGGVEYARQQGYDIEDVVASDRGEGKKIFEEIEEAANETYNNIATKSVEISNLTGEVTDATANQLEFLSDKFIDLYSEMDNQSVEDFRERWNELTEAMSSDAFIQAQKDYNALVESYNDGELSVNELQTSYSDLKTTFSDMTGLTGDLISKFVQMPESVVASKKALKDSDISTRNFTQAISDLNDKVDDFQSTASDLTSVYETLNNNEQISQDTIIDLIQQYPQYATELNKLNDKGVDRIGILKTIYASELDTAKGSVQSSIASIKAERDKQQALLDTLDLQLAIEMLASGQSRGQIQLRLGLTSKDLDLIEQVSESTNTYNKEIAGLQATYDSLNRSTWENVKAESSVKNQKSSKSSSSTEKTPFEKELNTLQKLRTADKISVQEYYDGLVGLRDKYFNDMKSKSDEQLFNLLMNDKTVENTEAYLDLIKEIDSVFESDSMSAFKKKYDVLKEMYDAGKISADDYYKTLKHYNDDYFSDLQNLSNEGLENLLLNKDTVDRTKEYLSLIKEIGTETKKISDDRKQQIDDAISGVQQSKLDLIQDKIDLLKEAKQAKLEEIEATHNKRTNSLEDDKDYWDDYYSNELSNLEKQYDAQTKANEAVERAIALAKARERLSNIKKERNVRILKGDKFEWVADPRELKKAQEEITELLKTDAETKRKNEYETEKQRLEDLKRLRAQELSDEIEQENRSYEKLKERETEYYDSRIENLETFHDSWSDILSGEVAKLEDYKATLASLSGAEKAQYADRLEELQSFVDKRNAILAQNNAGSSNNSAISSTRGGVSISSPSEMSSADKKKIALYQSAWKFANRRNDTDKMNELHEKAENVRKKYGFSGGADGSKFVEIKHEGLNAGFIGNVPFDPKHETIVKALKGEVALNKFDLDNVIPNTLKSVFSSFKMPKFTPANNTTQSTVHNHINANFPNVESASEIKQAISSFDRFALQT